MADEASIIANPTSTPAAVSTGYQAQNTRFIAQANGLDCSVIEGGAGQVTVKISGPVDVNGVLYAITADAVLAIGGGAGRYVVYLAGAGNLLTPTLEAVGVIGTFDPTKNARYTAGGKRILNWLIYYDGATATLNKWMTPESDNNHLLDNDTQEETFITGNGTWTAKKSKFYDIWVTGKGGGGGAAVKTQNDVDNFSAGGGGAALTGKKRIYIDAGTVWTAVFSAASGGNTTFSDGVTTLSAQNGYTADTVTEGSTGSSSNGGKGGTSNSGFDIYFGGGDGLRICSSTDIYPPGSGGNSIYGGGGQGYGEGGFYGNGQNGHAYGSGGGGGGSYNGIYTGNGGTGASGLIRIIG